RRETFLLWRVQAMLPSGDMPGCPPEDTHQRWSLPLHPLRQEPEHKDLLQYPHGYSISRIPFNPKSPPWKTQVKEDPEPPASDTPPENVDYGKIPLMALQGRLLKKEEGADGQHEQEVPTASNLVLYVKEEPQESIEFGMRYGQKPNLSAIQRIQVKEEPCVEVNHQESQSPKGKQKKSYLPTKQRMMENLEKSMSKDPSVKAAPRGEGVFLCPECGKSFNQKSNLTRHRKIHTSEGPYKCSECGESFRMNRKLIRHQRVHISEPFKCSECGKSFTQRSNLVRHQRIHAKEEPYQCPECEKTFNQKKYLRRHQKIHEREGTAPCLKQGEATGTSSGPHHNKQRALYPVNTKEES
uniref:C2H2-type domain-containing protein n=1 Tax=Amazona collaria TaxID=241587 RepID=A0A8B9EXB0_9PSIT